MGQKQESKENLLPVMNVKPSCHLNKGEEMQRCSVEGTCGIVVLLNSVHASPSFVTSG